MYIHVFALYQYKKKKKNLHRTTPPHTSLTVSRSKSVLNYNLNIIGTLYVTINLFGVSALVSSTCKCVTRTP